MARQLSNPVYLASPQKGVDGRGILTGARAPLMTDGRIGDFWLDSRTDQQRLYGPKNAGAWPDLGLIKGNRGWTPVLAAVVDGARRVQRVIDWQGGEGPKPAAGKYVGSTGLVDAIGDALDIRGPVGPEMVIDGLATASAEITDVTQLPVAEPANDNEKRSVVEIFDLGAVLDRVSIAHAAASIVRKDVKRIRTQFNAPDYDDPLTLGGGAEYVRVNSQPAHAARFRSVDRWTADGNSDSVNGGWWEIASRDLDIRMFGARGDGLADDTAAFLTAGSQAFAGREVRVPAGTYVVQGTIPVYSKFVGVVGKPTIKLTVNGGADMTSDRGFWMKSGSGMHNVAIERGVTAGSISGEFNNAVVVGEYCTAGTEYTDIHMSNVDLIGVDAGAGRRSIMGIYGNVHDCTFSGFTFSGYISYACMTHWGGNFDPTLPDTGPVTLAWRPRRLVFEDFFMRNPMPDQALGCIYLSGVHDVSVKRMFADGIRTPIVIAAGDIGGLIPQGDSAGRILKGISFEDCTILNYAVAGIQMSGASGNRAGSQWLAINEGSQIRFQNLSIQRGALSSTNTRAMDIRLMTGVTIEGLDISHGVGASDVNYTPAVFIQACENTKISGSTKVPFAHELIGCGKNVAVDTHDVCLRTDYDTNCYGTRLTGQSGAVTLGAALSISDRTVLLTSLPFDVVAGSTITVGGRTMVLTKAAVQDANPVTLSITASFVAASSGSSATLEKYTGNVELSGYCEGFYVGVLAAALNSGKTRGVSIRNRRFKRCGMYDVYGRAARGLSIMDCSFEESGQLDTSAVNNIRLIDACADVKILGNSFENNEDASTLSRHNVYLYQDTIGAIISGNRFHNALTSAINKFAPTTSASEDHVIADNWFGPLLPAGTTGRISGTAGYYSSTVGDRRIGWAAAIPTTGSWRQGDILNNTAGAAAGKAGWVCVTAGNPGTWKPFGAIDA